jgi:hypothetical protein
MVIRSLTSVAARNEDEVRQVAGSAAITSAAKPALHPQCIECRIVVRDS